MPDTRPALPARYRVLNAVGTALRRIKIPIAEFDEEHVCNAAIRQTGLSDFGDPYYRAGLRRLLDSAANARLHFSGRVLVYRWIVIHLVNRLSMVEARKRRPEILTRSLIPPIVVLGLPRSGTTYLHRMLAIDPAHRGVPMWELTRPIPPADGKPDRRRRASDLESSLRGGLMADMDRKHYIRSDEPEECMWMLGPTFVNLSYWVLAPVYGYLAWYVQQDLYVKKYAEYRLLLQVLQAADPGRRLVMKAPEHTGQLDVLLQAVPEALIVQAHRDPVAATNSFNSLIHSVHLATAEQVDLHRMARANLDYLAYQARSNLAARRRCPGAVHDVAYDRLAADPIGAVRGIYDHYGLVWPTGHEERLQAHIERHPKGKHGEHRYRAEDYGLTDDEIAERYLLTRHPNPAVFSHPLSI